MSNMAITSKSEWGTIDWAKVESAVTKLQRRIFRASKDENIELVHNLQKLLLKSLNAKLLAVRKVTQENKGKKTPGVDGVADIPPQKRMELAFELEIDGEAKPTRRVYIPKRKGKEMRALGIPTIGDRAKQALFKLALEPEWEAKFEKNSYGFRLGRNCHDAIEAARIAVQYKPKFVLDADIEKCFDKINHKRLIEESSTVPTFRRQIKAWLKSGVMENDVFQETESGTPQGGIISPLLANIALHGLETLVDELYPATKARVIRKSREMFGELIQKPTLVRYADDFVVMCEHLPVIENCKEAIEDWLSKWGLRLKEEKTRIVHTKNEHEGNKPGFDFLGVNIRQYEVGNKHSKHLSNGDHRTQLGYKSLIKPSEKSVRKHYRDLAGIVGKFDGKSQKELIGALQKRITGWCNYYKPWNSKETFAELGHLLWKRLWRWANRRHPGKGADWVMRKYWQTIDGRKWIFAVTGEDSRTLTLRTHDTFQAGARYVKVRGDKSPFDGDDVYWLNRLKEQYKTVDSQKARLIIKQDGKCAKCGEPFRSDSHIEKHHRTPRKLGGSNADSNLVAIHLHCHDRIHNQQDTASI